MTCDAEHTPSPQSVVVPVEPTPEMIEAAKAAASFYVQTYEDGQTPVEPVSAITYRAMLAAAPAPSSLAGGEVVERLREIAYRDEASAVTVRVDDLRAILAALSPEAPAREGATHPDAQPFERFPELALHIERMAMTGLVGSMISWDAFLRELNAALPPRHEAPAEGAGERDQIKRAIADGFSNGYEPYDEAGEMQRLSYDMAADAVIALSNRTSEPEAGGAARIIACHLPIPETPDTVCLPITMTAGDLRSIYAALRARSSAPEARSGEGQ